MQSTETTTCSVPECDKRVKRQGYCYGHYMKQWRYGTPHHEQAHPYEDLTGVRFGALVVTSYEPATVAGAASRWSASCDCGETASVRAGDLRSGSITSCGKRSIHARAGIVGYGTTHQRLAKDRGRASEYACIDCGLQAAQWSYDHADERERTAHNIAGAPRYSLDPDHYDPRCVPCHKRFDLGIAH